MTSNFTVELFRNATERDGREHFSCSFSVWNFLGELGRTFGWQPTGTTYVAPPKRKIEIPVARNYQPGDALDHKRVETEDAAAWARAIETARRSPHFHAIAKRAGFDEADSKPAFEQLSAVLDEFVEFAHGGAFTFALPADESAHRAE